jgi:hypothetical protein
MLKAEQISMLASRIPSICITDVRRYLAALSSLEAHFELHCVYKWRNTLVRI